MNQALFSSRSCEHSTPQALFDELHREFGFVLDVCATPENAKCAAFYTREQDGLTHSWRGAAAAAGGVIWMNPPYGRAIGQWVSKARAEAESGATVVALLPARTDTRWWHEHIQGRAEVRFVRGRLRFGGAKTGAPFPSAIVVFRGGTQ